MILRSNRLWLVPVIVAAVMFTSTATHAEVLGKVGPIRTSPLLIASQSVVQKHVGFQPDEIEKVAVLADEFQKELLAGAKAEGERAGKELGKILGDGDLEPEEKERRLVEVNRKARQRRQELDRKYTERLKRIVDAEHFNRIQQIFLQTEGSCALQEATIAMGLSLSRAQQEKIAEINADYDASSQSLFRLSRPVNERGTIDKESLARWQALLQKRDREAVKVLTGDQQAQFAEMKGKPFDLTLLK